MRQESCFEIWHDGCILKSKSITLISFLLEKAGISPKVSAFFYCSLVSVRKARVSGPTTGMARP